MPRNKFMSLSTRTGSAAEQHRVWETALAIYECRGCFQSITIKDDVSHSDVNAEIRNLGLPLSTLNEPGCHNANAVMSTCLATIAT